MRNRRRGTYVPLSIALAGCALAAACAIPATQYSDRTATPADSANAHRAAVGFLAAFDSLQWEPFRTYLADDVTMFFPFPKVPARAEGRAAVESVFEQFMTAQREGRIEAGVPTVQGLAPRDLRVQMLGTDAAVVSFHLGQQASPSRRSIVFRRSVAGRWQVAHWHASPTPQDTRR